MPIIRNRAVVSDHWRHLPDDADLNSIGQDENLIVSRPRWERERQALLARNAGLGLRLSSADALQAVADDLRHFQVIALAFGVFTDGRGYSQARLLRQRYGYRGEIRAVGAFLPDQVAFLERCGVNAFEISRSQDIEHMLTAFSEISIRYQPAADSEELIFHRRRQPVTNRENP